MAQLMPLPLSVSCFSKIHIDFTFLVPDDTGGPGKRAVKRVCVCVCVCVCACVCVMYLQKRRHRCGKWNWLIIDWLITPPLAGVLFSPPFVCAFVCWVVTIIIIIIMVVSPARDIASLHHHVHDRLHTPPVVNRITQNVIGVDFLKRNLKIVGQRWVDYISEVIRDIFLA